MCKLPQIILDWNGVYKNKYLVFLFLHADQVCSPVVIDFQLYWTISSLISRIVQGLLGNVCEIMWRLKEQFLLFITTDLYIF